MVDMILNYYWSYGRGSLEPARAPQYLSSLLPCTTGDYSPPTAHASKLGFWLVDTKFAVLSLVNRSSSCTDGPISPQILAKLMVLKPWLYHVIIGWSSPMHEPTSDQLSYHQRRRHIDRTTDDVRLVNELTATTTIWCGKNWEQFWNLSWGNRFHMALAPYNEWEN